MSCNWVGSDQGFKVTRRISPKSNQKSSFEYKGEVDECV